VELLQDAVHADVMFSKPEVSKTYFASGTSI